MRRFNHDIKTAITALKILIMSIALLSFPGDALGQTVKSKKYNLKTQNMAVEEIARTDSTVMYSWKTLISNWDSITVRFKVKVILKDSTGSDMYLQTTEDEYKLEAGEGMLADSIMVLPIAYAHLISKFAFKFDYTPQLQYEAAIMLFNYMKSQQEGK